MQLLNADGSCSEVSGNGVRCLAAWLARDARPAGDASSTSRPTPASRRSSCWRRDGRRARRSAPRWASPTDVRAATIDVDGATGRRRHAPRRQPAVRRPRRGHARSACTRSRPALAVHPRFPDGTNVELAHGRGAGPRPHPDLGARRRADRGVGHRRVRVGGGGDAPTAAPRATCRCRAGRRAARRVDRRRAVPDRLGGTDRGSRMARPAVTRGF